MHRHISNLPANGCTADIPANGFTAFIIKEVLIFGIAERR